MSTRPSLDRHGNSEIRVVTQILKGNGIPCCIVGVSALMFYGVPRMRDKWEICIPDDMVQDAVTILEQRAEYVQTEEKQLPQPLSLAHSYVWFQGKTMEYKLCLVPATHARIAVGVNNVCTSTDGLPYAPLDALVQSFLDMNDRVSLCDIVDGLNLDYEWGKANLDLNGTTDVEWAHQRNAELMGGEGNFDPSFIGSLFPTARKEKMLLWRRTTEWKQPRLAQMMLPHHLFETRYKLKGAVYEPWRGLYDWNQESISTDD